MIVHGTDHAQAGFRTVWTGEAQKTYTSQALEKAGLSETAAEWTDAGIGVALTAGTAVAVRGAQGSLRLASKFKGKVPTSAVQSKALKSVTKRLQPNAKATGAHSVLKINSGTGKISK